MVHPEIRDKVPDSHVSPAEAIAEITQGTDSKGEAHIREHDEFGVFGIEKRASGIKVVDLAAEPVLLALASALALAFVEVVSRDVGHEVIGPSDELLEEQVQSRVDGCLLTKVTEFLDRTSKPRGLLLAGSGKENHVTLHVAGCLVVSAMGKLPAEVGYEKSRVDEPTGEVADEAGGGEGAVATFMRNDPKSCSKETL